MIIAIDGPAGSGKSTVTKLVANQLGFHYLDTGAMYRCVARFALDTGVSTQDDEGLASIAREHLIEFVHEKDNPIARAVYIDGKDVTALIRTPEVDKCVSAVAAVPAVREALVAQQRLIAAADDIAVEGRDIGTVVFPDAQVKVFLTASAMERAKRRALQTAGKGLGEGDLQSVYEDILARDKADSKRSIAPLCKAQDAVELDTTEMSVEEVVAAIVKLARDAQRGLQA